MILIVVKLTKYAQTDTLLSHVVDFYLKSIPAVILIQMELLEYIGMCKKKRMCVHMFADGLVFMIAFVER